MGVRYEQTEKRISPWGVEAMLTLPEAKIYDILLAAAGSFILTVDLIRECDVTYSSGTKQFRKLQERFGEAELPRHLVHTSEGSVGLLLDGCDPRNNIREMRGVSKLLTSAEARLFDILANASLPVPMKNLEQELGTSNSRVHAIIHALVWKFRDVDPDLNLIVVSRRGVFFTR